MQNSESEHGDQTPPHNEAVCPVCGRNFPPDTSHCSADQAELVVRGADSLVGTVLDGQYRIEAEISVGVLGTVYKAIHVLMGRHVTLKVLHSWLCEDEKAIARLKQEAKALTSLDHRNIVRVHDFAVSHTHRAYLVMDDWEGTSLSEKLSASGRLAWVEAIPIFLQICDALEHAHKQGIIHRNLCPANIILTRSNDAECAIKIIDFGMAKLVDLDSTIAKRLTPTGDLIGSPVYMSPEQCQGKVLLAASDIYSLGCVMYEVLSGQPPFSASSPAELVTKHLHEAPVQIDALAPGSSVPRQLEQVILKAMEKESAKRFQSAGEVAKELQSIAKSAPGASPSMATGSSISGISQQRKTLILITGVAIVLLAIVLLSVDAYLYLDTTPQGRIQLLESKVFLLDTMGTAQDQRLIIPLETLIDLYQRQGNWPKAKEAYRKLLPIVERRYGSDSFQLLKSMLGYASILKAQGDNTAFGREIRDISDRAVVSKSLNSQNIEDRAAFYSRMIDEKMDAKDETDVWDFMRRLALYYYDKKDYSRALSLFGREAEVLTRKKAGGISDGNTVNAIMNMGDCYKQSGDYAHAEHYYAIALEALKNNDRKIFLAKDNTTMEQLMENLAQVCAKLGNLEKARSYAAEFLKFGKSKYGPDSKFAREAATFTDSINAIRPTSP